MHGQAFSVCLFQTERDREECKKQGALDVVSSGSDILVKVPGDAGGESIVFTMLKALPSTSSTSLTRCVMTKSNCLSVSISHSLTRLLSTLDPLATAV